MRKKILMIATLLSIFSAINVTAKPLLKCSQIYYIWLLGTLTATDTPVPYVINFSAIGEPSSLTKLESYPAPGNATYNDWVKSSCQENSADGSLEVNVYSIDNNQKFYTAVINPSEPNIWNITQSNLPLADGHNYVGKLSPWHHRF